MLLFSWTNKQIHMERLSKLISSSIGLIFTIAIVIYIIIGFVVKQYMNVELLTSFSGNYFFKLIDLALIGFIAFGIVALFGYFIQKLVEKLIYKKSAHFWVLLLCIFNLINIKTLVPLHYRKHGNLNSKVPRYTRLHITVAF